MISLSGDGKALSFFLSESVQHKETWHLVLFTGNAVDTWCYHCHFGLILVN